MEFSALFAGVTISPTAATSCALRAPRSESMSRSYSLDLQLAPQEKLGYGPSPRSERRSKSVSPLPIPSPLSGPFVTEVTGASIAVPNAPLPPPQSHADGEFCLQESISYTLSRSWPTVVASAQTDWQGRPQMPNVGETQFHRRHLRARSESVPTPLQHKN